MPEPPGKDEKEMDREKRRLFTSFGLCAVALCVVTISESRTEWRPTSCYERSDLVAVGQAVDSFTSGPRAHPLLGASNLYWRVALSAVVKGTYEPGNVVVVSAGSGVLPKLDTEVDYLFGLKLGEDGVLVSLVDPWRVALPTGFEIPSNAPIEERVRMLLLATVEQGPKGTARAAVYALASDSVRKNRETGYGDLILTLRRIQKIRPEIAGNILHARMMYGDKAVLDEYIEACRLDGRAYGAVCGFEAFKTDDIVTTLNLILEGKRWPWMEPSRVGAAAQLREIGHVSSLPYFIAALDDPDSRIRFYAFTGVQKLRGRKRYAPLRPFFDPKEGAAFTSDAPLSEYGIQMIQEAKEWWETEGKRQFDYVLPEEK